MKLDKSRPTSVSQVDVDYGRRRKASVFVSLLKIGYNIYFNTNPDLSSIPVNSAVESCLPIHPSYKQSKLDAGM